MTLSYIMNVLLFILPAIFTLYIAFKSRLKSPSVLYFLLSAAVYLIIVFASAYLYIHIGQSPLRRALLSIFGMFSAVVVFQVIVNYTVGQCLFIISVIKCYTDDVTLLASFLYLIINGELPESLFHFPVWCYLTVVIITLPVICIFYVKMLRPALDYTESLSFWSFMWVIPVCNDILYTLVIFSSLIPGEAHPGKEFYLIPSLWVLLSFSTYVIMLKMITEISKNAHLQEKLHISETQTLAQRKQAENFQQCIETTSRMRHDMRHHLLALQGFLVQRDYTGMETYLKGYIDALDIKSPELYTESAALNAIFTYYKDAAEEHGISFRLSLPFPSVPGISEMDLCIILGNLIENALEACIRQSSSQRFIELTLSMPSKSVLVILVRNSYDGHIKRSGECFLSSKEKGRRGIGISSVLNISEKYNGISRFEYDNQIFKVSLLLTCTSEDIST